MQLIMLTMASGSPYGVNAEALAGFWPAPESTAPMKDDTGGTFIQLIGENEAVKVTEPFEVVRRMVRGDGACFYPVDFE